MLWLAASLERGSEHPLAAAIVAGALERGMKLVEATDFRALVGKGVVGTIDGKKVALGNPSLLQELRIQVGRLAERAEELRRDGQTVMFVVVDGVVAGLLAVADPIKPSTPEAIRMLGEERVQVAMLTGDNRTTAEAVARKLGISDDPCGGPSRAKDRGGSGSSGKRPDGGDGGGRYQRCPGTRAGPCRYRHGDRH